MSQDPTPPLPDGFDPDAPRPFVMPPRGAGRPPGDAGLLSGQSDGTAGLAGPSPSGAD